MVWFTSPSHYIFCILEGRHSSFSILTKVNLLKCVQQQSTAGIFNAKVKSNPCLFPISIPWAFTKGEKMLVNEVWGLLVRRSVQICASGSIQHNCFGLFSICNRAFLLCYSRLSWFAGAHLGFVFHFASSFSLKMSSQDFLSIFKGFLNREGLFSFHGCWFLPGSVRTVSIIVTTS